MLDRVKYILMLDFIFFLSTLLQVRADVIYLHDGEILIGTIKQTTTKGVLYDTYKGEVEVELYKILRTEPSLENLKKVPIAIYLKDSSVLKGTVVDYDSEIGVFLDISFGTLTVPRNGIERMVEMNQSVRYNGRPFHIAAGGGMYLPVLKSREDYGASWISTSTFQLSIPAIRGLYAGIGAAFLGADYTTNSTTEYYFITICPEVTYKYLDFRLGSGFLTMFTPFITLSGGLAYIHISDPNLYPSSYGDIDLYLGIKTGIELSLTKQFSLEIAGLAGGFLQQMNPFTMIGAIIQIGYDF